MSLLQRFLFASRVRPASPPSVRYPEITRVMVTSPPGKHRGSERKKEKLVEKGSLSVPMLFPPRIRIAWERLHVGQPKALQRAQETILPPRCPAGRGRRRPAPPPGWEGGRVRSLAPRAFATRFPPGRSGRGRKRSYAEIPTPTPTPSSRARFTRRKWARKRVAKSSPASPVSSNRSPARVSEKIPLRRLINPATSSKIRVKWSRKTSSSFTLFRSAYHSSR